MSDAEDFWKGRPKPGLTPSPEFVQVKELIDEFIREEYIRTERMRLNMMSSPNDELQCTQHYPRQHRDGKPPWCRNCGLTEDFKHPVSRFWEKPSFENLSKATMVTLPVTNKDEVIGSIRIHFDGRAEMSLDIGAMEAIYRLVAEGQVQFPIDSVFQEKRE